MYKYMGLGPGRDCYVIRSGFLRNPRCAQGAQPKYCQLPSIQINLAICYLSILVIRSGFEPETHSLEGCCSIQLSYRTARKKRAKVLLFFYIRKFLAIFLQFTLSFFRANCQKAVPNLACGMLLRGGLPTRHSGRRAWSGYS